MRKQRPDCTGQKFGELVVLGKVRQKTTSSSLWLLRCNCGNEIVRRRADFETGRIKTCGCGKNKQKMGINLRDLTGQKFGALTVLQQGPYQKSGNRERVTWLCLCDCGRQVIKRQTYLHKGYNLSCGAVKHLPGSWYPPTPDSLPAEAWTIIQKYLNLASHKYRINSIEHSIEDACIRRLHRAAWIIFYKRSQGENITELHEKRIIQKYFRYAKYDKHENTIGVDMTNGTYQSQPVDIEKSVEALAEAILPKRLKFKTC